MQPPGALVMIAKDLKWIPVHEFDDSVGLYYMLSLGKITILKDVRWTRNPCGLNAYYRVYRVLHGPLPRRQDELEPTRTAELCLYEATREVLTAHAAQDIRDDAFAKSKITLGILEGEVEILKKIKYKTLENFIQQANVLEALLGLNL